MLLIIDHQTRYKKNGCQIMKNHTVIEESIMSKYLGWTMLNVKDLHCMEQKCGIQLPEEIKLIKEPKLFQSRVKEYLWNNIPSY